MKRTVKGISITRKFFALLAVMLVLAAADYLFFVSKSGKVESYDEINNRLGAVRISMTKLEYLMDMFVVARRFEVTTVALIEDDVHSLDRSLAELFTDPRFDEVKSSSALITEGLASLAEDWLLIKEEVARLNTATDQDTVMLIHNAMDLHTIIIAEKAERLQGVIVDLRSGVFSEFKRLLLGTLAGGVLIFLILSLALYRAMVVPLAKTAEAAARVASGWPKLRFTGAAGGFEGAVTEELNGMLDSIGEAYGALERESDDHAGKVAEKMAQMEVIKAVTDLAARSISVGDIYSGVVTGTLGASGADATCLFVLDDGAMTLKAADGFDDNFLREFKVMGEDLAGFCKEGARGEQGSAVLHAPYAFPSGRLGEYLSRSGIGVVVCAPMVYDDRTTGYLLAAYRDGGPAPEDNRSFLEAVAHTTGVLGGYIGLIQGSHNRRKFLERIMMQIPFGMAVFDHEGRPVFSNNLLKRCLGVPQDFDFAGRYSVREDTVFSSQGLLVSIEKTFEGYSTDFIINYNPSLLEGFDFTGPTRRLKVKCYPLYDSGGDINEIVLLCEDLTQLTSGLVGDQERVS